ncbi:MAG: branched-chain amino acid ABC transporter permease [Proteobacteria bacterium]|nr:branched-chain amino acid ABC transporter permease [Pseudomonadota bacterium]
MDPAGVYKSTYEQDMAVVRTFPQWGVLIAAVILLFCSPLLLPNYLLGLMTQMGCVIIAAFGIQILTGYAGQVSVGHAAFFATGAYSGAILMAQLHFPFLLALVSAGFIAGLVGVIAGAPSLRVKGFYLVMGTLAGHYIIHYVILRWRSLTGGSLGYQFPAASFFGLSINTEVRHFYLVMIVLLIATVAAKNIVRTRMGRAFVAVRDNDLAANVMGINVWLVKFQAFFVGCFFAGVGGALWAHWAGSITPGLFPLMNGIWYLGYIIIGGLGSIVGCFFGVITVMGLMEVLSRVLPAVDPSLTGFVAAGTDVFFGLVIVLMLIFEPRGLAHRWEIFKSWYRIWPLAY